MIQHVAVFLPEHRVPASVEWCSASDLRVSGIEVTDDDCVVPGRCPVCDRRFTAEEVEGMEESAYEGAISAEKAEQRANALEWRIGQSERRTAELADRYRLGAA